MYFVFKISEYFNFVIFFKFYKWIVFFSVLYGSELWCDFKQKDNCVLDVFQYFICKYVMNFLKYIRLDMCELIFGFLLIVFEIDKCKLQLFGCFCLMDIKCFMKKIFFYCLFLYFDFLNCKYYGFIFDVIYFLDKYNLLEYLNLYL